MELLYDAEIEVKDGQENSVITLVVYNESSEVIDRQVEILKATYFLCTVEWIYLRVSNK